MGLNNLGERQGNTINISLIVVKRILWVVCSLMEVNYKREPSDQGHLAPAAEDCLRRSAPNYLLHL